MRGATPAEPPVVVLARTAMTKGLDALAAHDVTSALRWLERAHRLVPFDPNATLALAGACLAGDPARAAALFREVTEKHDVRQAWLGLAAATLCLDGPEAAADPLAAALSRHAFVSESASVAQAIAPCTGWCALRSDGRLEIRAAIPQRVRVSLDGRAIRGRVLPARWAQCREIEVRLGDVPLLGSPIEIAAIRRLAGCVEVHDGGIRGWAWHPGDPETPPTLTFVHPAGPSKQTIVVTDETIAVADAGALARPRSFHIARAELSATPGVIHVLGPDGKELPGSPLDPYADDAALVAAARRLGLEYPAFPERHAATFTSTNGPAEAGPIGADRRQRAVTIVIPVQDGGEVVVACLASVIASLSTGARILVVDDASTDPALVAALDDLAAQRKFTLLRHARALGLPASANAGIRAASGRDIVLLDSNILVPPGWLERLRAAARSSHDIGTVTPFSNAAGILSYPSKSGLNPTPDQQAVNRLDRLAARANGISVVDIPAGAGFCLYLRRDCLNVVGLFRADQFAQGYGEENDLCLRARRLGWRNVALTGLFVGNRGATAFTAGAIHLRARNARIVERLHPGYDSLIDNFLAADPLAAPRRRIDLLAWRARVRRSPRAVILVTHNEGGGIEQRLAHAVKAYANAKYRPIILRPAKTAADEPAIAVGDAMADDLPNLIYAMPRELPALLRLLRSSRPELVEVHHLALYPPAIYQLIAQLGLPFDVHVHDYAWFCPRIALVGGQDRYCGEPDLPGCEDCVADHGHFMQENITVAALRDRSAGFLSAARRVIVPSDDTATRMRRHFSGLATETHGHEDDASVPAPAVISVRTNGRATVCVVGAIGIHKGYDILLACARDAACRDLDLEFVVVGHTTDDTRIMATGRVFVTGEFEPAEAVGLITANHARIGFVPSIWPETWCLSLGEIWRAGLTAAAFDIGAPAERIRCRGQGLLLPLGLSAGAVNNALIAAMRTSARQ